MIDRPADPAASRAKIHDGTEDHVLGEDGDESDARYGDLVLGAPTPENETSVTRPGPRILTPGAFFGASVCSMSFSDARRW